MKRFNILYVITFILALCSIVYELVLAQSMAAFLSNTVLRYSVTVGLYMFSMGLGALVAEGRLARHPLLGLLRVEILLTVIGGGTVVWLHMMDILGFPRIAFLLVAHGLVVTIGILTGFEIPYLIEIKRKEEVHPENAVLAVDYAGAFLGTLVFAFLFYPGLGLMPTAFLTGFLNALAGVLLFTQNDKVSPGQDRSFYAHLYVLAFCLTVAGICLMYSPEINHYFMQRYLA